MKIIKFSAHWCKPCAEFEPIFDEVMDKNPKIEVERINVDKQPELWAKYRIMSIPTTIVFNDKWEEIDRIMWVAKNLEELINNLK